MQIAVAASIATDHLMTFEGRFADSMVAEQLDRVSLSFLVDDLQVRRGGVGANVSFGLGVLGLAPVLVGAVGADFAEYRDWLERHGVDCSAVHTSSSRHTARFVCTTDRDQAQIASFYPGAMSEARDIDLAPLSRRPGGLDLVLVGADDPEAMLQHTQQCRELGVPFVADPSQQLAFADGPFIRQLLDGAQHLFSNEYEASLIEQKTGWTAQEVLARVGTRVTTLGAAGARIERAGQEPVHVSAVAVQQVADPTGVGDAFRAGFLAGLAWRLEPVRCAQLGAALASFVVETVGTQEYRLADDRRDLLERLARGYGQDAADDVAAHLVVDLPLRARDAVAAD